MKYKEIKLFTKDNELDSLIDELNMMGYYEQVINDRRDMDMFKSPSDSYEWNYVDQDVINKFEEGSSVTLYFNEDENLKDDLLELIKNFEVKVSIIDDEDYLHKWEEYYVPTKIGLRTVSKPMWKEYVKKDDEIVIDINPGQAFGTGSSPTTYLIVRLMEKYIEEGDTVIDVGCGTGILTILASKLKAKYVYAYDLDPKAIDSTLENVKLNGVNNADIKLNDLLKDSDAKADVIVANLTADILLNLFNGISSHLMGKKMLILSGIIDFMEDTVLDSLKDNHFEVVEIVRDDVWVSMVATFIQ